MGEEQSWCNNTTLRLECGGEGEGEGGGGAVAAACGAVGWTRPERSPQEIRGVSLD